MSGDTPTVDQAWNEVMRAVQAIKKGERNKDQGFNFRGIDTVMSAVGPELRTHGVTIIPTAEEITTSSYETKRGTTMFSAIVKMRYTVRGPAGDSFEGGAFGEAADAGDKAVSKAQSVAYRVFLLQGLTIPTDEPEPDAESHQRAAPSKPPANALDSAVAGLSTDKRAALKGWCEAEGLTPRSSLDAQGEARVLAYIRETLSA